MKRGDLVTDKDFQNYVVREVKGNKAVVLPLGGTTKQEKEIQDLKPGTSRGCR